MKSKYLALLICTGIITIGFFSGAIGKKYIPEKDFNCCVNNQLVIKHFYKTQFFFIEISFGYTAEPVGKPVSGGCNIQCSEH